MGRKKTTPPPICPVAFNRWYPMCAFPVEIAVEAVVECACCQDQHIATWSVYQWAKRPYRAFVKGRFDAAYDAEADVLALSEFSRFKLLRLVPGVVIDPKVPMLAQEMYRVREEIRSMHADQHDYSRVVH